MGLLLGVVATTIVLIGLSLTIGRHRSAAWASHLAVAYGALTHPHHLRLPRARRKYGVLADGLSIPAERRRRGGARTIYIQRILGRRHADGSITVNGVAAAPEPDGRSRLLRLTRRTSLAVNGEPQDRCGVGLGRLAGLEGPFRLARLPDQLDTAKTWPPTGWRSFDVEFDHGAAEPAGRNRATVIGIEPDPPGLRLMAWCHRSGGMRTFVAGEMRNVTACATGEAIENPVEWLARRVERGPLPSE